MSLDAGPNAAVQLRPGSAPFDACPNCDSEALTAEATTDRPVFRCTNCGMGWLYELGYIRPTDHRQ